MCEWRPRLKTDEEIFKAFKEEMAEELSIIEGTQEQADMLADIDEGLCPYCGRAFNSKMKNAECPVCGKDMGDDLGSTGVDKPSFTNFGSIATTQEERNKKEYLALLCEKSGLQAYEYEQYIKNKCEEYKTTGKAWIESLPVDENEGIRKYTRNAYVQMNNTLVGQPDRSFAGTKLPQDEVDKFINCASSALNKIATEEAITVFSGQKIKNYGDKYTEGKIVDINPFISASPDYYKAWGKSAGKDLLLQIELPKGSHAGYVGIKGWNISYDEREITINCKQKYEVIERGMCIRNGEEVNFLHLKLLI